MKTTLKDWPKVYRKLKGMSWSCESERIRFARCLAATPEERWEMNANCLRLLGMSGRVRSLRQLERQKAKLRDLEKYHLWWLQLSNEELGRGPIMGWDLKQSTHATRKS
jgi:hypothetical protein